MSLRIRVVTAIVLVLLLGSVAGLGVAGWQAKRALREELAAALVGGRQTVASAFEDLPHSDHPARDLRQLVATFDGNRHLAAMLVDDQRQTDFRLARRAGRPAPGWFRALLGDALPDAHVPAPVAGGGVVVLRLLYANDVGALWREFIDLAGVLAASVILGAIAAWLTVGRALRPLAAFSDAFVRIGSGDYAARVPRERTSRNSTASATGSTRWPAASAPCTRATTRWRNSCAHCRTRSAPISPAICTTRSGRICSPPMSTPPPRGG